MELIVVSDGDIRSDKVGLFVSEGHSKFGEVLIGIPGMIVGLLIYTIL